MEILELINIEAAALDDDQREAVLEYIRCLRRGPIYATLPPEVLESIERGQDQLRRGEKIGLEEASARMARAARQQTS